MNPPDTRITVLINPSARSSVARWRAALEVLESRAAVSVVVPPSAAAMDDAVRAATAGRVSAIVVVGGDGTVNRVINALAGDLTPIGLIPLGTGNDFARALAVPTDPAAAARRILDASARDIDLIDVNGRLFCTAGLLGVPADAALSVRHWLAPGARTRPLLHVLGGASYSLAGMRHLLRFRSVAETYEIDAGTGVPTVSLRAHGAFFANTPVLGGGLVLPVGSDASDGTMEIVMIPEMPRWRLLYAFLCFSQGWPVPAGTLRTVRASRAVVRCEGRRPFAADGDFMGEGSQFTLTVKPCALRVIA
jgi:diacylglycerol kinase family enzyme